MNGILLALILLNDPIYTGAPEDRVYLMELNHHCDGDGKRIFTQCIFYERNHYYPFPVIKDFVVVRSPAYRPRKIQRTGLYVFIFHKGQTLHVVRSDCFKESYTLHDPELTQRQLIDRKYRTGLTKPLHPNSEIR